MSLAAATSPQATPAKRVYVPAVGPRLRILLNFVFVLCALLGANSLYLAAITFQGWLSRLQGLSVILENWFYQYMFLAHLALGFILIVPFVVFGLVHIYNTRERKNKRAIRVGYALFVAGLVVLITGVMLVRFEGFDLRHPLARGVVYWMHVVAPLLAVWLYWLHRLAGPKIKWRVGLTYLAVVVVVVGGMIAFHTHDPRQWNVAGPKEGEKYFTPSLAITDTGNFIPADTLMMDSYCLKCHEDAYKGWFHSAHHFSSFNNPMYLASVAETREVSLKRDGNVQASRWCAGCHDPVPFFSGAFDDPKFDMRKHPTSQAGITCTVCHSITHIESTKGNADFVIEEPVHYPFAKSDNAVLQFINNQLVKAKPAFHKQTFLKPLHKSAEFCSTCHKVHLPKELNHYKEFLRGQNHYDTYLMSGASGHGSRSFYYPPKAFDNCAVCHMPLTASKDFGAKLFDNSGDLKIHDHLFPGANTALPFVRGGEEEYVKRHADFLKNGVMRVDIFGVREGGTVDGNLIAPLRPELPALKPGSSYLLETVLRTLKIGHPFTQGTVDSNEIWVDVTVTSGDKVIGRSGGIDEGEVDPWSHFVNVYMLDRNGNRIDRRNPQDIFTPLYNHQIPPGAAQVAHYRMEMPDQLSGPVTVNVKVQYRKFDKQYMDFVTKSLKPGDEHMIQGYKPGTKYFNNLPIVTLAEDSITFPVEGDATKIPVQESKIAEADRWQRWNDYGIALGLEGVDPMKPTMFGKAELRQAEAAFKEVEKLGRVDGAINLARVHFTEGLLDEAVDDLKRAAEFKDPSGLPWTMAWLSGVINRQQGRFDEAIENFQSVVGGVTPQMAERGFDFSIDIVILNELGIALREKARQFPVGSDEERGYLKDAVARFEKTLTVDSEDVVAHHNLSQLYRDLGETEKAEEHADAHARYKVDENAKDRAINLARQKSPAANAAAEAIVIYPLHRTGAPGLAVVPQPEQPVQAGGGGD